MPQYIDKSSLVAEIEKLIPLPAYERETLHSEFIRGKIIAYNNTLDLLNNLEVKEVDLDKEIREYMSTYWSNEKELHPFLGHMAKHFFELGLKAQKGEEV